MKYHKCMLSVFISFLVFTTFFCLFLSAHSFAHSGRTDSSGGHHVSATGEYHYHHGQSAHQHYDLDDDGDLDCPITFNREEPKNTPKPVRVSPPVKSVPQENVTKNAVKAEAQSESGFSAGNIIVAGIIILFIWPVVSLIYQEKKAQQQWQKERVKYQQIYSGKKPETFVKIPSSSYIGADGLPVCRGTKKWGDKYTFYRTATGTKFHVKFGCSGAKIPLNIANIGTLQPCRICKPTRENIDWFWEYQKIVKIKKDFKID